MLIAGLLILLWVVLVVRYPARALLVSALGLTAMLLLAGTTLLLERRESARLAQVSILIELSDRCPAPRPLLVSVHNPHAAALHELRWQLSAHLPAQPDELLASPQAAQLAAPALLPGHTRWQQCVMVPALRPGYRLEDLAFSATNPRGRLD